MSSMDRRPMPEEAGPALDLLRRALGEDLIAAYLYGSAVAGGLRPHSDLDLLAVVAHPIPAAARRRLVAGLLDISGPAGTPSPARPLELTAVVVSDVKPWRYPPRCEFQFGEWLREELTAGALPQPRQDPDLTILLHDVLTRGVALIGPPAARLFDPTLSDDLRRAIRDLLPDVVGGWRGDERNAVLTLARMWLTLATGEIVPKDIAAARVAENFPAALRPLLQLAAAEYRGERRVDWAAHRHDVAALVRHAEQVMGRPGADD